MEAFLKQGVTVTRLEYRETNILKLERSSFLRRISPWIRLQRINKALLSSVKKFQPDLVLVINGEALFRETIQKISTKCKVFHWAIDGISNLKTHKENFDDYDLNYVFEPTDVPLIPKSVYLPLGVSFKYFYPTQVAKTIDVSFIGSPHSNRLLFLENLAMESRGKFNFQIFGPFQKVCPSEYPNICSCVKKNSFLTTDEIKEIYAQSKISLNPHHTQSKVGLNPRVFEISACKTFQLCSDQEYLTKFFSKEEVASYKDLEDLIAKIMYFLSHEDEREEKALSAYKIAQSNTFENRIAKILNHFWEQKNQTLREKK